MNKNYLQYLVDMFTREKLYNHYRYRDSDKHQDYGAVQFMEKNHHLAKILKNIPNGKGLPQGSVREVAKAAVDSFLHRVAPKLMLSPQDRIKYPLRIVAEYIVQTIMFVQVQAKVLGTCPFQYDTVFAFNEFVERKDDDEENSDDDDEDADDSGDGAK